MSPLVLESADSGFATIALNDPERRNALSLAMFDALDAAMTRLALRDDVRAVILRGEGPVFCAGFDLAGCVDDPELLPALIMRLSASLRRIRRMPQPVIAQVHGAAIAGGCALLSACDFVFAASTAQLGYPVHAIGISPAVTIPTLRLTLGDGAARSLLISGELVTGAQAHERGLVTHLADSEGALSDHAQRLAAALASKGPRALCVTKAWLNTLDGSDDEATFDGPDNDSAQAARHNEARNMLANFWTARRRA